MWYMGSLRPGLEARVTLMTMQHGSGECQKLIKLYLFVIAEEILGFLS